MTRPTPFAIPAAIVMFLLPAATRGVAGTPDAQPAVAPAGTAGQVLWGKPAGGVRLGLACTAPDTTSDRPPRFKVVLENVSAEPVRLPAANTYVERPAPADDGKPILARPLRPIIAVSAGRDAAPVWTGSGDEGARLPAESFTLDPGKSVAFDDLPLEAFTFRPGQKDYGTQTTRQAWWLMAGSAYRVTFAFENGQAEVGGQKVWTGRAESEAVTVRVEPPAFDAGTLPGEFVAEKADGVKADPAKADADKAGYFVGEPIYVTLRVTNKGKSPISFPDGGDYRGTGRHERFTVRAWDAAGRQVPDPIKPSGFGGGLGGDRTIRPGETYTDAVLVNLWCPLTKPGQYTVECRRTVNVRTTEGYAPEEALPAVPITSRLTITVRRDEAALAKYLKRLPDRLDGRGEDDAAKGLPNGTSVMRTRDELRALALARNGPAFDVIAALARRPGTFRAEAIQWLEAYGKDKAGPALLELARSTPDGVGPAAGDENARRTALDALVRLGADGVGPVLLDALSSADAGVRAAAVMDCARARPPGCFAKLMAMADDPAPIVRRYLGAALAAYGDAKAVPVLVKLLNDPDPDRFIRIWAAGGLGKLGRTDGVPVLIELLRDPKAEGSRGNVVSELTALTGQRLPDEYESWKKWWDAGGGRK